MNRLLQADPVPLREDAQSNLRVGDSRVLLESVLHAFREGATPEVIVQRFDTLQLSDVYAVLGHCLRHSAEVEEYLRRQEEEANVLWKQMGEVAVDWHDVRARLEARRAIGEKNGAASRQ